MCFSARWWLVDALITLELTPALINRLEGTRLYERVVMEDYMVVCDRIFVVVCHRVVISDGGLQSGGKDAI